jgi:hypothetical protein
MEYARQALITLYTIFEELENIGSLEPYIIRIADEFQKLADIIRHQDRELERQHLEIESLKAELELANTVFGKLNADVAHMRYSVSQVLQPLPQTKKIEELM